MTKFVVDTSAVLHLASTEWEVPARHELLAPTLIRSQTLSALHEAVHRDEESTGDKDVVQAVYQKGYKLGDKVIRPAVVKVGRQ